MNPSPKPLPPLALTFGRRLGLLVLLAVVGLVITGVVTAILGKAIANPTASTRIAVVVQNLIAFMLPAVIVAMMTTRLPADFLRLRRMPSARALLLAAATLVVAFPAIEGLNALCAQLPWPPEVLAAEEAAQAAVDQMIGPQTGANLALAILIVGVLTGICEELFFRGALQGLLQSRPMSVHLAIWLAALIFALMHGQLVGLLPRMLLGAYFGYVAVWTGSLWAAMVLHALNNSVAVATLWAGVEMPAEPALCAVSVGLAAVGVWLLRRQSRAT